MVQSVPFLVIVVVVSVYRKAHRRRIVKDGVVAFGIAAATVATATGFW